MLIGNALAGHLAAADGGRRGVPGRGDGGLRLAMRIHVGRLGGLHGGPERVRARRRHHAVLSSTE